MTQISTNKKLIAIRADGAKLIQTHKDQKGYPMGYLLLPNNTKSKITYIGSLTKVGIFKPVKGK